MRSGWRTGYITPLESHNDDLKFIQEQFSDLLYSLENIATRARSFQIVTNLEKTRDIGSVVLSVLYSLRINHMSSIIE